jgi:hypothetical protein
MKSEIAVDALGVGAGGETFSDVAAPDMVRAGYMINQAVVLRFPDGMLAEGNRVLVTPDGIDFLRREMPLDMQKAIGNA